MRGLSKRAGFTLIELLIVVVIIGILAAVAIPKFASTKGKAYVSTMKADLRNLATAQEGYNGDQTPHTYAANLADLIAGNYFRPSVGVNITIVAGDPLGWSATATHNSAPGVTCAYFYGTTAPVAPATTSGEVRCS